MCPFSYVVKARGYDGPIHHLHLCRNAWEGCNPAHRPGLEVRPDDRGSRKTGRIPPARQESRCALFCSTSFSAGALSGSSTYRKEEHSEIIIHVIYRGQSKITLKSNSQYKRRIVQEIKSNIKGSWGWGDLNYIVQEFYPGKQW